jgi:hypothetical protein
MPRIDITQDVVVERVVARLRDVLDLPDSRCYETLEPLIDPQIPKGGDFFLTVSPGNGHYDVGMQNGGGRDQLMEQSSVSVTAYTKIRLDAADRATKLLHEVHRGVLPLKKKILDALVGVDLEDAEGNTFLRQPLYAMQSWAPRYNQDSGIAAIAVAFGTDFDWDLDP